MITVAMATGNTVGGLIIQAVSPAVTFLSAGALCLAGAALGALRLRSAG